MARPWCPKAEMYPQRGVHPPHSTRCTAPGGTKHMFPVSTGQHRRRSQNHFPVYYFRVLQMKIFSFILEESLTLTLNPIYILPNFSTETLLCPSVDPPSPTPHGCHGL